MYADLKHQTVAGQMVFAEIPLQPPLTLTRHSGDSCLFTEAVLCKNCRQMVFGAGVRGGS